MTQNKKRQTTSAHQKNQCKRHQEKANMCINKNNKTETPTKYHSFTQKKMVHFHLQQIFFFIMIA